MTKPKGFAKHKNGKAHPVFDKKGITEDQMRISVKGNNDTIEVGTKKPTGGMKGNREAWKMLPESERKILISRIWNETLTKDQKRSAIDEIIRRNNYGFKNDHWYDAIHSTKFEDLPKELQDDLLEKYKYRTTLRYDSNELLEKIDKDSDYYVTNENGLYVLRQKRFRDNLKSGKKHPHDIMAYAHSPEEMADMYQLITNSR